MLFQIANQVIHLLGRGVAHRVGDIQCGGAGGNGVFIAPCQEGGIGAGSVLGGKFDIPAQACGVGHHLADGLEHLLPGHLQLVLHVDIAGGQEDVDAGLLCFLHGVPGGVNVPLGAPGQACHHGLADSGGDGLHAFVVHGRGDGKTRLDDIHPQLFQLPGHFDLFRQVHAAPGGLLAVPEGGVKNFDALHVGSSCFMRRVRRRFHMISNRGTFFRRRATKKASVSSIEETKAAASAVPLLLANSARFPYRPLCGEYSLFGNGEETRSRLNDVHLSRTTQGPVTFSRVALPRSDRQLSEAYRKNFLPVIVFGIIVTH